MSFLEILQLRTPFLLNTSRRLLLLIAYFDIKTRTKKTHKLYLDL